MHQIGRAKSSWLSNTHRKLGHWSKYTLFNLFGKNKHFSTCTWPFTIWCERTKSKTADYLHKSYNFRVNVHKSMEKKIKTGKRTGQDIYANNWIWTNDEKTDCKSFGFWSFVHMNEQAYMYIVNMYAIYALCSWILCERVVKEQIANRSTSVTATILSLLFKRQKQKQ